MCEDQGSDSLAFFFVLHFQKSGVTGQVRVPAGSQVVVSLILSFSVLYLASSGLCLCLP